MTALSAVSLKLNTTRLSGSRGSAGLPPEVAQPASSPARSSAARSLFALATRSVSKFLILFSLSLSSFIVQELTNQILQHDSGLREFEGIAVLQVGRIAPGRKADVLFAEQSRGHYLGGTVLGKLKAAVDVEGHHRLEAFVVEMDLADPADDHAGTFHRRADLQTADVFEFRLNLIHIRRRKRGEVRHLQRKKQHRADADHREDPHPQVQLFARHHD